MHKMRLMIALVILAILASACAPAAAPATPDLEQMRIAVQQTLDFEKAVNAQLTQAAQTDQALAPVQQPATQEPPTQEPPPTVQVTSSVPLLSVSMDTNCREGPNAEIWKSVGGVMVGEKAEIVAKYIKGHWYIVKLPSRPNERCWVYDFYATIEGDTSTLPKATIPPTPTPKP